MQILWNGKEIKQIISDYSFSGGITQISRKCNFNVVVSKNDKKLPSIDIKIGDQIAFLDNNNGVIFIGKIYFIEESDEAKIKYTAYDNLISITKSKISKNFNNVTPAIITRSIANELNLSINSLEDISVKVSFIALKQSPYDVIMKAYTKAKEITGINYMIFSRENKLNVVEQGKLLNITLEESRNIIKTSYSESAENIVNKVQITDADGNTKSYITDEESIKTFGVIQVVYQEEDGKNTNILSKAMLQGIEKNISLEAIGNVNCISGFSIMVKSGKVVGKFYIEQDTHTYVNGLYTMQLKLNFQNIMDEKEIENNT